MKTIRILFTVVLVALGVAAYVLFAGTDSDYSPSSSPDPSNNSLYQNIK